MKPIINKICIISYNFKYEIYKHSTSRGYASCKLAVNTKDIGVKIIITR
jgi:hypothetical protein